MRHTYFYIIQHTYITYLHTDITYIRGWIQKKRYKSNKEIFIINRQKIQKRE